MNLLFTCVGRRNYLVDFFKRELSGSGIVVGADANKYASALSACDKTVVVPSADSPEYVPALLDICRQNDIDMLCPLNDLELPVLARAAHEFKRAGVVVAVSSPAVVDTCFDKVASADFLSKMGVATARVFTGVGEFSAAAASGEADFPAVVKPRWGSGSIGVELAYDARELRTVFDFIKHKLSSTILRNASLADWDRAVIIQPKLRGDEYGLDVVNDFDGNNAAVFVKKKIRMRAGETDMAQSCDIPQLSELGRKIGTALGHIGNLDCDVFFDGENAAVLEMNPRFGGGYPFTHCAGGNVPKAYLAWASGKTAPRECFDNFKTGEIFSKCDRLVGVK